MRLGFIVAPRSLAPVFRRIAEATSSNVATSVQWIMADFIDEGHFATHLRRMRNIYRERHKALIDGAAGAWGGAIRVHPTVTGFHTIGEFSEPIDEVEFCRAAHEKDVVLTPISRFASGSLAPKGLVLGFSATPRREIVRGITVIADILKAKNLLSRGGKL